MAQKNGRELADFLYEAGMLKTTPRSGWNTVRAPPESVAEHSFRTALVGYVLSKMAGLNEKEEAMLIKACLLHDLHEARIGDLHKLAKRYGTLDEKRVESEQRRNLPDAMREDIAKTLDALPAKLKQYAHEADKIECAISAKEYMDAGYKTKTWIENTRSKLKTREGHELLDIIERTGSNDWLFAERDRK